jgi:DNA-directed RNA polymerase specialized sigma24 family protein
MVGGAVRGSPTHLRAVAYRMLGSLSEADDAVQESWLHLSRSATSGVENLGGWLTTVVFSVRLRDPKLALCEACAQTTL